MKTFIAAQIGLAPLAAFWLLLGFASPGVALAVGLAASLAMTAWRWSRRELYADRTRRAGDLPGHGGDRPRRPRFLRRFGVAAVLRRPRPRRGGERRTEAAVDRRLFARGLFRRIGKPDLRRRQHDDLRALGGAVPRRLRNPGAEARWVGHRRRVRVRRGRLDLRAAGADPLRARAPNRPG